MGTVSIDPRSVVARERGAFLGGSRYAARSSNQGPNANEQAPIGILEDHLRGALQSSPSESQEGNGGRLPAQNDESCSEILKFAYPKGKRDERKKSARCKRRAKLISN
ncbi:uncharacterized protein LOC143433531 [Xylocopa sonorina]|uniref:uncharacterized protein LOC143433531 n=1 Tax=Xylocopa sonorina TaxID=1818115 RepID=UPI00403AAFCB